MGGAARNEKRRKQEAAARKLGSAGMSVNRKSGPNRMALIMVAVVVVFALLVGGFVLWSRTSGDDTVVPADYPVAVSGAVVTAGTGPVVVDVYEDYLCPICERFEQSYGSDIKTALNEDKITVRYHAIAILDERTDPVGYSTRAANAALCAADGGFYPAYHEKLFAEQPAEGSSGLTDDQLVAFGTELGAGADFAGCVTGGIHSAQVTAETEAAASNANLQTDGQFGTPTVAIDSTKIDISDANWLQNAIAAG